MGIGGQGRGMVGESVNFSKNRCAGFTALYVHSPQLINLTILASMLPRKL